MNVCTNCGEEAADVYCAKCGERQPHHHDLTIGHFLHDLVHELVHMDSKLFRTLRELVTMPGHLTAEYFAGRKSRYISPLRLFIALFALQFVVYTFYKPASMFSLSTMTKFDSRGDLTRLLAKKSEKYHLSVEDYAAKIDARWQKNLSLLQFANILGIALVLALLYRRRHRHFVEHLVFAAHFLAFAYIVRIAIWPIFAIGGFEPGPLQRTIGVTVFLISVTYIYLAIRRYYGDEKRKAAVKTLLLWGGTFVVYVLVLMVSLLPAMLAYR